MIRPTYQVTELLGDGIGAELSRAVHALADALQRFRTRQHRTRDLDGRYVLADDAPAQLGGRQKTQILAHRRWSARVSVAMSGCVSPAPFMGMVPPHEGSVHGRRRIAVVEGV